LANLGIRGPQQQNQPRFIPGEQVFVIGELSSILFLEINHQMDHLRLVELHLPSLNFKQHCLVVRFQHPQSLPLKQLSNRRLQICRE
jgi:hypothetical protein